MDVQAVSRDAESEEALAEIEKLTEQAAESVRPYIHGSGLGHYKNFLDTMYHYTRNTGDKAREAAENVSNKDLGQFFLHFEKEEAWHYRLAREDLKSFELEPSAAKPQVIADFDAFWASLKGHHSNRYLGALYVFENIVKYLINDVVEFIAGLNLSPAQCRWLATHAKADMEHGEEVIAMMKKHIGDAPAAAVESARRASELWANIMRYAFELPVLEDKKI